LERGGKRGVELESDFAELESEFSPEDDKNRIVSGRYRTGEADKGDAPAPSGQNRIAGAARAKTVPMCMTVRHGEQQPKGRMQRRRSVGSVQYINTEGFPETAA